ncbi:hypothetical protein I302_107827 [Kwoniella bestiolae CBS 10118]|uniref:Uncharacterized protein n=1 Tax=Kwoniella bestiolae CBS 10118 TaxID=1296100 RepID=A0A1B9FXF3_9TREE|nr:hypothetical protein I302_06433 [Kwoniella bestiolae CBS 10118]OCF23451.1 hypothetical protein I302_06433 [Kwoniella bestiolae CBS 10118]
MAAVMQPSTHRPPSMDRTPSFDQPRSRSTPPFQSPYDAPAPHVRTNSTSSNASPYNQPFANSYFPPTHQHQMYGVQPQQSWTANPVPATAFYNPPFQGFPNGGGQHPHQPVYNQFRQSQADFAAWANAYQHMVMASVQNGGHPGGMTPPAAPGSDHSSYERRRTSSGPGGQTFNGGNNNNNNGYSDQQSSYQRPPPQQQDYQNNAISPQAAPVKQPQPPQPYHPYKRGPSTKPSTERLPRSSSMPTGLQEQAASVSRSSSGTVAQDQSRTQSVHAPPPRPAEKQREPPVPVEEAIVPPPRIGDHSRTNSSGSERSASREVPSAARTASPAPRPSTSIAPTSRASTPLHPGPITNATNTPSASRPSPLSQPSSTPEPTDKMVKTGGLKGRLRKALDKDAKTEQRSVSAPSASVPIGKQSLPPKHFASPSESSTRSATPPATPPQEFRAPSAPFTMNPAAMGSEISLAETERTATVSGEQKEKGKRSLFRMKNMSTDNISLSSTVSSASMMIRKMGSIGKLARRNSLMGISRIFKDKPKEGEDAALPEKDGKKKKDKKNKKGKGEAAPATISHAVAESDRLNEEEDRALAGLSPAAKLARQHTLRSRAEAVKKDTPANTATGEPTWDQNTATRQGQNGSLPSLGSMGESMSSPTGSTGPEVVRVNHAQAPTVVHAVAVTDQEYDSADDSSDGETVEDVTMTLAKTRLSAEADAEFQATWGNAWIDRNAIPKKGILKAISSYSNLDEAASSSESRQRSNSTHTSSSNNVPGPLAQLPSSNPALLDGLVHPSPQVDPAYDPFSPAFSPFDSPTTTTNGGNESFYANPNQNSSAPALSLIGTMNNKPPQNRSMTAPVARRRINWAPECAVYQTYDSGTYDRRSEPATCNRLTPELAMAIKQELNAFKLEMPVHPSSKMYTHYFAW